MDLINRLIMAIDEAGLRISAYGMINGISWYIAMFFGLIHGMKLKIGFLPSAITVVVYRLLVGPLMTMTLYVQNGFTPTSEQNGVVVFTFVPFIAYVVSKFMRRSYKEIWDTMMIVPLMMFAGARIACTVTGCCRGYPCEWGIFNAHIRDYVFPIQLLESFVTILILVYVFWREKKNHFISDGRNVPIMLISYGAARFFLEFLHDNKKFFGFNWMQVHCVLMIVIGLITWKILQRSEKKSEEPTL